MATPNIVNVATINAKNATALLDGTSRTTAVDVAADKIANTISVPADATLSFLENPIYLDETDILAFTASAANDLTYFVSYEELDDA
jgi:hypothetical protein